MCGHFYKFKIVAHDKTVAGIRMACVGVFGGHQIGGHHRRDQARDQQRKQHGDGHGQAELSEILPGDARHERHRHKHRDDGEGGGDDGQADFIGGLNRGAVRGFAHADMSGDIFYLDDRVIHQDARGQRDRQERNKVQRKSQHVHHPERGHGRQWQGDGGDQRGAPVAQECQHHQNRQKRAFQQGGQGGFIVAVGVEHGFIDQFQLYFGMVFAHLIKGLVDGFGNGNFRSPLGAEHRKRDDLFAVQSRERSQFFIGVDHLTQIRQAHKAARWQGDGGASQFGHGCRIAQRADRLFARANFSAACTKVGIRRAQLCVHRRRADAETVQFHRIKFNADLAVGAAEPINLAHTGAALQRALDHVIDEP